MGEGKNFKSLIAQIWIEDSHFTDSYDDLASEAPYDDRTLQESYDFMLKVKNNFNSPGFYNFLKRNIYFTTLYAQGDDFEEAAMICCGCKSCGIDSPKIDDLIERLMEKNLTSKNIAGKKTFIIKLIIELTTFLTNEKTSSLENNLNNIHTFTKGSVLQAVKAYSVTKGE